MRANVRNLGFCAFYKLLCLGQGIAIKSRPSQTSFRYRFMFLTIVLVPVMYYTVDLVKEKMEKWFGKKSSVRIQTAAKRW